MVKKSGKKMLFGKIKVEQLADDVVNLPSGMSIRHKRNPLTGGVDSVTIHCATGDKLTIGSADLVQAAKVVVEIDDGKLFVCPQHGSYETTNTRQTPKCSKCMAEDMDPVAIAVAEGREAIDNEG